MGFFLASKCKYEREKTISPSRTTFSWQKKSTLVESHLLTIVYSFVWCLYGICEYLGCLEEGICKNPGDTYEKDCQKYECQPNGQGFQIIDSSKLSNG